MGNGTDMSSTHPFWSFLQPTQGGSGSRQVPQWSCAVFLPGYLSISVYSRRLLV
jgi:hypothetical protein